MVEEREPRRVQLSRKRGWRMPDNTVKVSRPGRYGNPFDFRASKHCWTALAFGCRGDRAGRQEASVKAFRDWITPRSDAKVLVSTEFQIGFDGKGGGFVGIAPRITAGQPPSLEEVKTSLRGKNLACWCRLDQPCHADVLLELANRPICQEVSA